MKGQQSEELLKLKDLQPYRVTRILGDDIIVDLKLFDRECGCYSRGCFLCIKSIASGVKYEFGGLYFEKSKDVGKKIFDLSQRRHLFSLLVRGIRTVIEGQAENAVSRFILLDGNMTVTMNQGENIDKKRNIPMCEAIFSVRKDKICISAYGDKFEAEINMPRFYAMLNDALDYFDSEVQRVGITLPNVSEDDDIDVFVE